MSVHTLNLVDPSTLLVDKNIREAKLTTAFIENVRELGVLQPPIVHQSEEGLRVVMGHRRTLAAVEAKLSEIPVLLADTVEEADRLAQQVSENDLREGLTDAERGTAFEQMALLGVTPAQIAKRAGAGDVETVKRALAAKKDPKAAEALTAGYSFEEALALSEFDGDEQATARLEDIIQHEPGMLAHEVQQIRDENTMKEKLAVARDEAEKRGLSVVNHLDWTASNYSYGAVRLSALQNKAGEQPTEADADSVKLTLNGVDEEVEWNYGIKDWKEKGFKAKREGAPKAPMTEEEKAERRTLIANNKAADAAQAVRREWVAALLAKKQAPKGWQRFLALAHTVHHYTVNDYGNDIVEELLSLPKPESKTAHAGYWALNRVAQHVTDHPARPEIVLIALVCAGFEGQLRRDTWRDLRPAAAKFYLTQLAEWGYTLSEVEQIITTKK